MFVVFCSVFLTCVRIEKRVPCKWLGKRNMVELTDSGFYDVISWGFIATYIHARGG